MLHIYRNKHIEKEEENDKEDEIQFKSRIILIDIIISETMKLMKTGQNSETLLILMQKFIILRGIFLSL